MTNLLVDLKEKGKTKTTKEAKNMRAMDDDDEEYQPLEDENNLDSDDHLSEYNDEEELIDAIRNERIKRNVVAQHPSTPHTEIPPMQSIVPPSSTQGSMPTPSSMAQLEARHQEDESRRKEDEALRLPVTMPKEEMPMEVLGKKFYVKEYGVGLKRPSSKQSSAKSHDEVRVLKNQVQTLKDMCQEQKNQFETLKDLCQTQHERIRAYDEKFARFDAVMPSYTQGGLVGEGSNSCQTFYLYNVEHSYVEHSGNETFEDVVVYKEPSTYDNLLMALGSSSKSIADVYQRR
ncbi:hypothetical protein AAC387_Pa01g2405 [Persea americana]